MTAFKDAMFNDEDKAREALEALRWPDGPYCPHCGNSHQDKIAKVEGKKQSHRPGLYYCNECKGQFTVTVGTVFERSKVPLTKWWLAAHLLNSSKKGISAHQIHRTINVTYKTAWFMMHRLREAMADMETNEPIVWKSFTKTIEGLRNAYSARNEFVHAQWKRDRTTAQWGKAGIRTKGGKLTISDDPVELKALEQAAQQIWDAGEAFTLLCRSRGVLLASPDRRAPPRLPPETTPQK